MPHLASSKQTISLRILVNIWRCHLVSAVVGTIAGLKRLLFGSQKLPKIPGISRKVGSLNRLQQSRPGMFCFCSPFPCKPSTTTVLEMVRQRTPLNSLTSEFSDLKTIGQQPGVCVVGVGVSKLTSSLLHLTEGSQFLTCQTRTPTA